MEKEEDNIVSLTGYRGEMTKPIIDMNAEELKVWEKEINQKIRKNLFAKNMPFVHKIDGKIVAELADGTIEIIR
jgi:CRISPR/Cas system-associated protein Csx1